MLTQKQKDLLIFIHDRLSKGDIAPSFEEMKDYLGLKSKSGIHRLITGLVERGYLERLPHRARALEVKKLPPGMAHMNMAGAHLIDPATRTSQEIDAVHQQAAAGQYQSPAYHDIPPQNGGDQMGSSDTAPHDHNLSQSSLPPSSAMSMAGHDDMPSHLLAQNAISHIPLCGKIAAGTPIEAISHDDNIIPVPSHLLGQGEHFALTVEGDSMINAGIHDQDTIIIRRGNRCFNGDIVVALIDGEEATLKRYHDDQKGTITLIPENNHYAAREYSQDRIQVQGILHTLIRNY